MPANSSLTTNLTANQQNLFFSIQQTIRRHRHDLLTMFALASVASFLSFQGSELVAGIFDYFRAVDSWFEADVPAIFRSIAEPKGKSIRTNVHPLFLLVACSLFSAIETIFGTTAITTMRIAIAIIAFLWFSTLFVLLRLIGCRLFDAALFTLLAMVSAASFFWFVVPETRPFGSLTILLGLVFIARSQDEKLSFLWYVVISALTLSITVTNWMVGLIATAIDNSWKRFLQITGSAFFAVALMWSLQKLVFPDIKFLSVGEEKKYIITSVFEKLFTVIRSLIFHTLVMPAIQMRNNSFQPDFLPRLKVQDSLIGSGSLWGMAPVWLWIAILSLGLWALFTAKQNRKFRLALGLILLGQLVLHSFYGIEETFLYSLNFVPLLILLAALGTLSRFRPLVLVLTGILVISVAINNGIQFDRAVAFVQNTVVPKTVIKTTNKAFAQISLTKTSITIDGQVDKLWQDTVSYKIANSIEEKISATNLAGRFKALWDAKNLYILVDVTDDINKGSSTSPFGADVVEVYLDADNTKSSIYDGKQEQYAFGYGQKNVWTQKGNNKGVTFAQVDTLNGYRLEIQIPWGSLGATVSKGKAIGLEVAIADSDNNSKRKHKLAWWGVADDAWFNPRTFGTAICN